jgi:hypothetical protein
VIANAEQRSGWVNTGRRLAGAAGRQPSASGTDAPTILGLLESTGSHSTERSVKVALADTFFGCQSDLLRPSTHIRLALKLK